MPIIKGEKVILNEGGTLGNFEIPDNSGEIFNSKNLLGHVTAFVFWDNFDLGEYFKNDMKIDRTQFTFLQELENFSLKSNSKLNIIAPSLVSKNEFLKNKPRNKKF